MDLDKGGRGGQSEINNKTTHGGGYLYKLSFTHVS